jgi:sec-independent protein translocase protein TatA
MWHLLILLAVVLLLFGGRGKISGIMGDFAQGITAFKKGLKDDKGENQPPSASADRKPETIERS